MHNLRYLPLYVLLATNIHAATPPELTVLRQQYEKVYAERVTMVQEASISALNTRFTTALDNAATAAQQAGKLDDVLAIQDDKKRLAEKLPIPDDDEKTPEALKKLRSIYREQLKKLEDARATSVATILPAYQTKLQELETTLTKAGRIEEAKELRDYREGLAESGAEAPTVATTSTPNSPTAPAASALPKVKGDDRKAAEWVLSLGDKHRLKLVEGDRDIKKLAELPKTKFHVKFVEIDGRYLNAPLTPDALQVLSGLEHLEKVRIAHIPLPDDAFAFLQTLPALTYLEINDTGATDAVVSQVAACSHLIRLELNELATFSGSTLGELATIKSLVELRLWKLPLLTDAAMPQVGQLKSLTHLMLDGQRLSDASLPHLQALPKLTTLSVASTNISAQGLADARLKNINSLSFNQLNGASLRETAPILGPAYPKVERTVVNYDVTSPDDLAALAAFPKLTDLQNYGSISTEAYVGLAACSSLEVFDSTAGRKVTDDQLRHLAQCASLERISIAESEVTDAGLLLLVPLKKLKEIVINKSPNLSDAGVAAFRKVRRDVHIEHKL